MSPTFLCKRNWLSEPEVVIAKIIIMIMNQYFKNCLYISYIFHVVYYKIIPKMANLVFLKKAGYKNELKI